MFCLLYFWDSCPVCLYFLESGEKLAIAVANCCFFVRNFLLIISVTTFHLKLCVENTRGWDPRCVVGSGLGFRSGGSFSRSRGLRGQVLFYVKLQVPAALINCSPVF